MPDPAARRVLLVGGAGVFGAKLAHGILHTMDFGVLIAGRDEHTLRAAASRLGAGNRTCAARISTVALDTARVTAEALAATGAFAVLDAAGPFQGGDYRLARAAIAAGLPIIDLADARDFVAGFGVLDAGARQAGVAALTGASSTPALSNAALDTLTEGWSRIDRVEIAISPGNRAPRGLAVLRSILSYTGQEVRVFMRGAWRTRRGWGMTVRRDMPGLGRRFLSLAETPDLDIVPARFRVTDSAIFRAGLELPVLHIGLWAAGLMVRARLVRSLTPFARPIRALAVLAERFGTDRGGMTVSATGADAGGQPVRATWWLVAEAGDGPVIPTLPALAALRRLAAGAIPPGAVSCVGVLGLAEIEAEFAPYRIKSGSRVEAPPAALFRRVLGRGFDDLPASVRQVHEPGWGSTLRGTATVASAQGVLARAVAAIFRFPPAGVMPVTVTITPERQAERWVRDFGGRRFASVLSAGTAQGCLRERFGILSFDLSLQTGSDGVTGMPVTAWRCGRLRLPRMLAPASVATESEDTEGRFWFDVALYLPLGFGRLVRYHGWLTMAGPDQTEPTIPSGPNRL